MAVCFKICYSPIPMKPKRLFYWLLGACLVITILVVVRQGGLSGQPAQGATPERVTAPVVTEAEAAEQIRQTKVAMGQVMSWIRRPDLEGKTFDEALKILGARPEDGEINDEPPTSVRSLSYPFQRGNATAWITLGVRTRYLGGYQTEFLEEIRSFPIDWAVETPYEPIATEPFSFESWIVKLREAPVTSGIEQ